MEISVERRQQSLKRRVSTLDLSEAQTGAVHPSRRNRTAIDVDHTMRSMDTRYGTHFYEWIRDEQNVDCAAMHLRRVAKDYDISRISHGVRWVVAEWRISSIAKLLRVLCEDWAVAQMGTLTSMVSNDWPLAPFTSRLVHCMARDMPIDAAVEYVLWLTEGWSVDSSIELVAELKNMGTWTPEVYDAFVLRYVWAIRKSRVLDPSEQAALRLVSGYENNNETMAATPTQHTHAQQFDNVQALSWGMRGSETVPDVHMMDAAQAASAQGHHFSADKNSVAAVAIMSVTTDSTAITTARVDCE
eukprot:comp19213_c0_seq1/m.21961 comp19213_c0_seq1/g.21961  ORF comp19213_c0_seq1/g.21961 comp19213_c0_seq1/m.21961 type:complete len:301 (-) comp19213_c0_seq1:473-1375(-)